MALKFALLSVVAAEPTFEDWAQQYGFNGGDEMKAAYDANVQHIQKVNSEQSDFVLGVNKFSGFTVEQFQEMFTGEVGDDDEVPAMQLDTSKLGTTVQAVDWAVSGPMNPVKDQGACGSCWAFGAVGVLEHTWALKTGNLYTLAEQQLVDCDTAYDNGCSGGLSRNTFSNYYKSHGACEASAYPYRAVAGSCKDAACSYAVPSGAVVGYSQVDASASALKAALMDHAYKVSVYAESTFQSYTGGIATGGGCTGRTNHAVICVGFGSGFFKIRNSWGSNWGEAGYIRVSDTSSCASGSFDMFVRTPIAPQFSSLEMV